MSVAAKRVALRRRDAARRGAEFRVLSERLGAGVIAATFASVMALSISCAQGAAESGISAPPRAPAPASAGELRRNAQLAQNETRGTGKADPSRSASSRLRGGNDVVESPPGWNGRRAMRDIEKLLSFGPRALDAPGHERAIAYIRDEMSKASAKVELQRWTQQTKEGTSHALTNVIVRLDPGNPRRIIVGTHYDSIVRAYRDRENPNGVMPGANNSGSGVALLLETARLIAAGGAHPPAGIDFVFFDGEEGQYSLGEGDNNWFPLGSPYFAQRIDALYPGKHPEKAVIFDMVCYSKMRLRPEQTSLQSAPADVARFWKIGRAIAPDVFVDEPTSAIFDDQMALARLGIPSFLVIGFEYDPWFNTTQDTLDKCSAKSLEAVGRTLVQFLQGS